MRSEAEGGAVHEDIDFIEHVGGVNFELRALRLSQRDPSGDLLALLDFGFAKIGGWRGRVGRCADFSRLASGSTAQLCSRSE